MIRPRTDGRWHLSDIATLTILVLMLCLISTAVSFKFWGRPTTYPTAAQRVLKAVGPGSFYRSCGKGCEQATTGAGTATGIEITSSGEIALLLIPQESNLDQTVVTGTVGRQAWKWVGQVNGFLAEGGTASVYASNAGGHQLTLEWNQNLGYPQLNIR